MTPSVPDPERIMRTNLHAHSSAAGSSTRIELMRASSVREDTPDALADQVISGKHSGEEKRPLQSEWTVIVSQAALTDTIAGIPGLSEDAVTTLVITDYQNGE